MNDNAVRVCRLFGQMFLGGHGCHRRSNMIEVKEISLNDKRGKKKFFKFLIDLYRGNKYAAPNFYFDEFAEFDPAVNDAFRFADCRMFLAYKNGKIAGRIAGIWHRGANEKFGKNELRFTRFDVIDDFEVTKALFDKLFAWAKELGMEEIIGPISFSDLNEEGMLIDGFDKESSYIELYNYPYYVEHMEKLGAYKVVDWTSYLIKVPEKPDMRIKGLAEVIREKNGFKVLDMGYLFKHDKKAFDKYGMKCLDVLDEAFAPLFGTSPLNEKQKAREFASIKQVYVPELACVVVDENDDVAVYGFMMPRISEAMRKGKGHIFPFGLVPFIKAMNNIEIADMMSVGVTKKYANTGAVAVVIDSCLDGLIKLGVKYLETGPELENNSNIQHLWKSFDPQFIKRRRCWGLKVN